MGDFSRSTFDRLKHYVGVRLQQGVPLLDADWNELEDIRRYEVQAFLKWFVGDGVPAGNDGFRIAALPGGGVNTIRLTAATAGPGISSVRVDVAASTAAAALGFTAPQRATRALAAARLTGEASEPFALTTGMTLVISVNGAAAQTVTFTAGQFKASDVVTAINAGANAVVASVGAGDDFVITGGDGTAERAGRCLVDGRDAVQEGRLTYSGQPLFGNSALAAAWSVPAVTALSAPTTVARTDLVYLDVWDREVTSTEDDDLVNPLIGVETAVRLRREWAVRVRPGSTQLPLPIDSDYLPGHSYLALATLNRQPNIAAIPAPSLTDLRGRNLQLTPSTLIEDVIGTRSDAYRRGENRPLVSMREAINAVLAGRVPASTEFEVGPGTGPDDLGHSSVVDSSGRLIAIWQATRSSFNEQVLAAVLEPSGDTFAFRTVQVTSGVRHRTPAAVALPTGDIVVAYNTGGIDSSGADILMKRAPLDSLGQATERQLIGPPPTGVADQQARAVLVEDQVVFFSLQGVGDRQWSYLRYRHTDNTFTDAAPVPLSVPLGLQDLHAAAGGGVAWVAYADAGNTIRVLRLDPAHAPAGFPNQATIDRDEHFPASSTPDVFVLASNAGAMVFYDDGTGLSIAENANGVWAVSKVPDTDASDGQPAAVRDTDGTLYLAYTHEQSGTVSDIVLRRRTSGRWNPPQRLVADGSANTRPNPIIVPNLGIWLLWNSNRKGNSDVFAKRIITVI